jgi:PAS domain S-box-containing protein
MNSPIAMIKQLLGKLRTINPWHFIWIIILIAEAFTFMLNALQSFMRWGYVSRELIEIGTIDALIVSLFATPVIIYSLKATNKKIEQDFTRRIQTENDLERSMASFEAIFNSIADAAIFVDTQRNIVMTNPAFTQIFGYGPEEVKGKNTMILYPKEADYQGRSSTLRLGAMEEKLVYECSYCRKDGTVFLAETATRSWIRRTDYRLFRH